MFLPLLLLLPLSCGQSKTHNTKIIDVHDGDTFTTSDNKKIRLFGVDTPEISNQFDGFNQTEGVEQIYARAARDFAANMLLNNEVTIEEMSTDKYSRTVASLQVGAKDLAFELVSHGLARVAYFDVVDQKSIYYSTKFDYFQRLVWAQFDAYNSHIGVWANPEVYKIIFPKAVD